MKRHGLSQALVWTILIALVAVTLFPIYLLAINSVKNDVEIKANPIGLPSEAHFSNFRRAFELGNFGPALLNSLKLAVSVPLLLILIAGFAAYALARMRVPGKLQLNTYLLFGMAVPPQLFLIPLYNNLSQLSLTNTHIGLVIVYLGIYLPFSIFFLRSFYLGLPMSIEEAARIDGCSTSQLVLRVILPMSRPALLSLTLIAFAWVWNEFMFAITLLQSDALKTASTQYLAFVSSHDVDLSMVASSGIITTIPVVVLFFFLQRSFIEGMTAGSVK